jgi:hypothetical protein
LRKTEEIGKEEEGWNHATRNPIVQYVIVKVIVIVIIIVIVVSFSDDEFVIGPCRSTATHDNDRR